MSFVVPEPLQPARAVPLALATGLAIGFQRRWGLDLRVKWPNDLLVLDGKGRSSKIAGILVDRVVGTGPPSLVVGFGVNVSISRADLPDDLRDRVAILRDLVPVPPTVDEVESVVTECVVRTLELLLTTEGARGLVAEGRTRLHGVGRPATVDGVPVGVIRDVADDGSLCVEQAGTLRQVHAGDLVVEET